MSWLGRLAPVLRFKPRWKPIIAISMRKGKPQITVSPMRIEPVIRPKPRIGPWLGKWFHRK